MNKYESGKRSAVKVANTGPQTNKKKDQHKTRNKEAKNTQPQIMKNCQNNSELEFKKRNSQADMATLQIQDTSPQIKHRAIFKQKKPELERQSLKNSNENVYFHAGTDQNSPVGAPGRESFKQARTQREIENIQKTQASIQEITSSLKQIHLRNKINRKQSQEMIEQKVEKMRIQAGIQSSRPNQKPKSMAPNQPKNYYKQESQVIHLKKPKYQQSESLQKSALMKKNLVFSSNIGIQSKKEECEVRINHTEEDQQVNKARLNPQSHQLNPGIPPENQDCETAALLKDIRIVNSNIENIYDNIKNSGKKGSPMKNNNSAVSINHKKKYSARKEYVNDKPTKVTKSYVKNANAPSGAKSSGRKVTVRNSAKDSQADQHSKKVLDFEQHEYSSAGRINQLSAPGSITSSEPRNMQGAQFDSSDGLSQPIMNQNIRSSQEDVAEQITQSYGAPNSYIGLKKNYLIKDGIKIILPSYEQEQVKKVSTFESQSYQSQKMRVHQTNNAQSKNSYSTSKKIPISKIKGLQNCYTQEVMKNNGENDFQNPSQIYKIQKFQMTNGTEHLKKDKEDQRLINQSSSSQETGFKLPQQIFQQHTSAGFTGSAGDESYASSGIEYKGGSSGCNSGSGKNNRRRLIFQRHRDSNSIDSNAQDLPKMNLNRIRIQDPKTKNVICKSTPRITDKEPQSKKPDILVLAQHVSKSNDSCSNEAKTFRKYQVPYQSQYHNKETLQKIINSQKQKKKMCQQQQDVADNNNQPQSFTQRNNTNPNQTRLIKKNNAQFITKRSSVSHSKGSFQNGQVDSIQQKRAQVGSSSNQAPQICETHRQGNEGKYQCQNLIDQKQSSSLQYPSKLYEGAKTFRNHRYATSKDDDRMSRDLPSKTSHRSKSDQVNESVVKYGTNSKKAKGSSSVVQASVESLPGYKKNEPNQFSRLQNRMLTRGLPTNRSVKSVVQIGERQLGLRAKEGRSSIQQKIASIKSQKSLSNKMIQNQGFMSNRSNNQKLVSNQYFSSQLNGLKSQEIIKSYRRNIVTRNEVQLGTLPEGDSTVLQGQTNSYDNHLNNKSNRFKTRHESGQGVIANDNSIEDQVRVSRNNLPKVGSQLIQGEAENKMMHQFASFGSSSSIQYQREPVSGEIRNENNSQRSRKGNQPITKQKSHVVLSPINKDGDNQTGRITYAQKGIGSIQLRSARNLPELKQLAKSPKTSNPNFVKIHKIKKMNLQSQPADNWGSGKELHMVKENSKESPIVKSKLVSPSKRQSRLSSAQNSNQKDKITITFNLKSVENVQGSNNQNFAKQDSRTLRGAQVKSQLSSMETTKLNDKINIRTKKLRNSKAQQNTERQPPIEQPYLSKRASMQSNNQMKHNRSSSVINSIKSQPISHQQNTASRQPRNKSRPLSVISSKQMLEQYNKDENKTEQKIFIKDNYSENVNSMIKTKKFEQQEKSKHSKQIFLENVDRDQEEPESKQNNPSLPNQIITKQKSQLNSQNNSCYSYKKPLDLNSQISSIKKNSSSKKDSSNKNLEYSKSALSLSPQKVQVVSKPKLMIKNFDLNINTKQQNARSREMPSTKIKDKSNSLEAQIYQKTNINNDHDAYGNYEQLQKIKPDKKLKLKNQPRETRNGIQNLKLQQQQISDIPKGPNTSNLNLNQLIDKLDDKFQLFSDKGSPRNNVNDQSKLQLNIKNPKQVTKVSKLGNQLTSESIIDLLNASNQVIQQQQHQKEFSNKDLMDDLEGLLQGDNQMSNRSNSIRFIDQQESLNASQKQALLMAENQQNNKHEGSFSSVHILKKLQLQQKQESEQRRLAQDMPPQDISPVCPSLNDRKQSVEESKSFVPVQQFYSTKGDKDKRKKNHPTQQRNQKDLLFDIEEEIRFNQQIDAIDIIQMNPNNLASIPIKQTIKEQSLPDVLSIAFNQNIDGQKKFAQNLPPAFNLLSPAFENSEGLNISQQLSQNHVKGQGIFSSSMHKSQMSNFYQEMDNFFPPVELMVDASVLRQKNIDRIKLLDEDSINAENYCMSPGGLGPTGTNGKLLLSNNYVTGESKHSSQNINLNTQITKDLKKVAKNYNLLENTYDYKS